MFTKLNAPDTVPAVSDTAGAPAAMLSVPWYWLPEPENCRGVALVVRMELAEAKMRLPVQRSSPEPVRVTVAVPVPISRFGNVTMAEPTNSVGLVPVAYLAEAPMVIALTSNVPVLKVYTLVVAEAPCSEPVTVAPPLNVTDEEAANVTAPDTVAAPVTTKVPVRAVVPAAVRVVATVRV